MILEVIKHITHGGDIFYVIEEDLTRRFSTEAEAIAAVEKMKESMTKTKEVVKRIEV